MLKITLLLVTIQLAIISAQYLPQTGCNYNLSILFSRMEDNGYRADDVARQVCGKSLNQLKTDHSASCECDRKAMVQLPSGWRCPQLDGCNCRTNPKVLDL